MSLQASELILNGDKSIYHLNLHPEDIATTILLVGDPGRVSMISRYFDTVDTRKSKREFITHTGTYRGKRISVVSTGIGTDNTDIVLNELDALANIDFDTRELKDSFTRLELVRVGTSGALQPDIPLDSMVMSELAIGFDGLLHFYDSGSVQLADIQFAFLEYSGWSVLKPVPYVVRGDPALCEKFRSEEILAGFTATSPGFYGPQGRALRLEPDDAEMSRKLVSFGYKGLRITNMEMETAGIFGLAALLGHGAASLNCILANRSTGAFSVDPEGAVERLIRFVLDKVADAGRTTNHY